MQQRTCLPMARSLVVLVLGLSCAIGAAPKEQDLKPLEVNKPFLKAIDSRLPALAQEPELFTRLHQEARFLNDKIYKNIRRTSLDLASLPLPALFKEDGTTVPFEALAVCMADRRIFVRGQREGVHMLGWVPLVTPDHGFLCDPVVVFLPVKDGKGKFLNVWGEHRVAEVTQREKLRKVKLGADLVHTNLENPKPWHGWLNQLLKEAIGHELKSTSVLLLGDQGLDLRGTIKTSLGTHNVRVRAGTDTFAVTVRIYPRENEDFLCCPSAEIYLKSDIPYDLPYWPPDRPPPPPPDVLRPAQKEWR